MKPWKRIAWRTALCPIATVMLLVAVAVTIGCNNGPAQKGKAVVGSGGPKELEPRPIVPAAEDVESIRIQADEGFLGGPIDETITNATVVADVLKVVGVVQSGPREIGDVAKHGRKGKLSIRTKKGHSLEFVLTEDRAIHFVSAFSINTAALGEIVKKHRAEKQ